MIESVEPKRGWFVNLRFICFPRFPNFPQNADHSVPLIALYVHVSILSKNVRNKYGILRHFCKSPIWKDPIWKPPPLPQQPAAAPRAHPVLRGHCLYVISIVIIVIIVIIIIIIVTTTDLSKHYYYQVLLLLLLLLL